MVRTIDVPLSQSTASYYHRHLHTVHRHRSFHWTIVSMCISPLSWALFRSLQRFAWVSVACAQNPLGLVWLQRVSSVQAPPLCPNNFALYLHRNCHCWCAKFYAVNHRYTLRFAFHLFSPMQRTSLHRHGRPEPILDSNYLHSTRRPFHPCCRLSNTVRRDLN